MLQASHTDDGFVQILRLLPVRVTELTENRVQGFWIRTIQDEMLQEPGKYVNAQSVIHFNFSLPPSVLLFRYVFIIIFFVNYLNHCICFCTPEIPMLEFEDFCCACFQLRRSKFEMYMQLYILNSMLTILCSPYITKNN